MASVGLSAALFNASSTTMPPPVIFPALTAHKSTVIIAHGLGDSGAGYAPIVRGWHDNGFFHDTKFILPSAPSISVTSAGGRTIPAWFDIRGERGPHVTFDQLRRDQDEQGLLASRDYFARLVADAAADDDDEIGVPASQVVVGGFSQGAVMAWLAGLTSEVRLGGIFCLSGYLPLADVVVQQHQQPENGGGEGVPPHAKEERTGMPVLAVHGDADRVINLQWAEESVELARGLGYEVDFHVVRGMGHSINQEVLAKVKDFITRVQETNGRGTPHDEL